MALAEHQQNILDDLLTKFGYHAKKGKSKAISKDSNTGYLFRGIQNGLALFDTIENQRVQYPIVTGNLLILNFEGTGYNSIDGRDKFIMSNRCADLISRMIQCHIMEQDFIIVGPKSSSKTICIREFARNLNMELLTVHLFNDMTTRDFLQIRQTRDDGSTCWVDSPLVTAAKKGCIAVLDGLEWVSADVLAGIGRLLQDRFVVI
ncbi:von Willebrand factor A domain-containing protein 8 [Globomyces sp. JEL0801]|nr:von Willebrand factor A domain-containing protein 8 [Globomyces sp. JEL0801]